MPEAFPGRCRCYGFLGSGVDKNQIEIGIVIDLTRSHLAATDHRKSSSGIEPNFSLNSVKRKLQCRFDARRGKLGELMERWNQFDAAAQIVQADADEFFGFVAPQGVRACLRYHCFRPVRRRSSSSISALDFQPGQVDANQRIDKLRPVEKLIGQKLTVREQRN